MSNADLIARLQSAMEGYDSDTLGDDPHEFDSWNLLHDAKAVLESQCAGACASRSVHDVAQPAPLVADSRDGLVSGVLRELVNALNFPDKVQSHMLGQNMLPLAELMTDSLLSRGVVSVASDGAALVADSLDSIANKLWHASRAATVTPLAAMEADYYAERLFASGIVSLAGDRDRASAERAWDDCAFQWAMYKSGPTPLNPYRESEARND